MAWAGENGNGRFMKMCKHQEKGYPFLPPNGVWLFSVKDLCWLHTSNPFRCWEKPLGRSWMYTCQVLKSCLASKSGTFPISLWYLWLRTPGNMHPNRIIRIIMSILSVTCVFKFLDVWNRAVSNTIGTAQPVLPELPLPSSCRRPKGLKLKTRNKFQGLTACAGFI